MSMEYVGVPLRVMANALDRYGKCVLTLPGLEGEELEPGEVITLDEADCARVNVAHWLKAELVELYTAAKGDAPLVPGVKRTKADRLAAGRAAAERAGLAVADSPPAAPPAGKGGDGLPPPPAPATGGASGLSRDTGKGA